MLGPIRKGIGSWAHVLAPVVLLYIGLWVATPTVALQWDILYWQRWLAAVSQHGVGHIYLVSDANYHPFFLYMLWGFAKLYPSAEQAVASINHLKNMVGVFDFAGALLALAFIKKEEYRRHTLVFLALLNLPYMYNTYLWGQTDSIHTFFMAASLAALAFGRLPLAMCMLVLSLAMKLQALFVLPIVGLVAIGHWRQWGRAGALKAAGAAAATTVSVLLPFIWHGTLSSFWEVVKGATDVFPNVTMNAFNVWVLLLSPIDSNHIDDRTLGLFGLAYRTWGLAMFFAASAVALWPLAHAVLLRIRQGLLPMQEERFQQLLWLTGTLTLLGFFLFNTQMHERYSHPVLLFSFLFAVNRGGWWLFALLSVAYFFNMERVGMFLGFPSYGILLFDRKFVASLFLLAWAIGTARLYWLGYRKGVVG